MESIGIVAIEFHLYSLYVGTDRSSELDTSGTPERRSEGFVAHVSVQSQVRVSSRVELVEALLHVG